MEQRGWNQTARISYRALDLHAQESVERALQSRTLDEIIADSKKIKDDIFVYRISPFLRILLKREGTSIKILDILDKRLVDAFYGRAN